MDTKKQVRCTSCQRMIDPAYMTDEGVCEECVEMREQDDAPDDDPICVCGVHRSEHALCGCPEGFQTYASWELEKQMIYDMDDLMYERMYGDGWS